MWQLVEGAIRAIPVMPLWGYNLSVEGSEGFEEVVIDDVALEFFFRPVPRAKGVGVPEVEVNLDEGGVHLEGDGTTQYQLLHTPVTAEGELVRPEELSCHGQPIHPHKDHAAKAS